MAEHAKASPGPDTRLHARARELLESGKLPDEDPIEQSIGPSSGARCALCYGAILEPHVQCTLEFAASGPTPRAKTLHFHVFCRDLWQAERRRRQGAPVPDIRAQQEHVDRPGGTTP